MKHDFLCMLGGIALGIIASIWWMAPTKEELAPEVPTPLIPAPTPDKDTVKKLVFVNDRGDVNMIITSVPSPIIEIKDARGKTRKLDLQKLIERLP